MSLIVVTSSKGVMYGIPGDNTTVTEAFKVGYIKAAPTMFVSLAGAQVDVMRTPGDAPPVDVLHPSLEGEVQVK